MEGWWVQAQELLAFYGLKIVAALIILVLGRWFSKALTRLVQRLLNNGKVDPTIVSFVGHLTYIGLMVFVVLAALAQLGIQTTSFIAVIGAAGLAIGLALQGSLSNFAAGFLMIIFRPFKVGDYIEGAGVAGTVEEIQVFTTVLRTPDNKVIIIPNAKIMGDNIINYSAKDTRRVDMLFGVGHRNDIDKVRSILQSIVNDDPRILKDPECAILVTELADSRVNFQVRAWVKSADYWGVFFDTTEKAKKEFDRQGISIPFPQMDVHVRQELAKLEQEVAAGAGGEALVLEASDA
ncbi:MAG: mechanosensitive ion channel domain-containing protein [Desulfomonilia bacterium]